ncbi:MAG: aminopeptidase [Deinococcales bacterium]
MIHPLLERYADLLVGYCTDVAPGEHVYLSVETPATELGRALVRRVLQAGAQPHLRLAYPAYAADVLELASDGLLEAAPDIELSEMRSMDAYIAVSAPDGGRALQAIDKVRLARWRRRNQPVQEERVNRTRWVGTRFPTAGAAQDAGMSLDAYERFVFDAMYLYDEDPVRRWLELRERQAQLIARLERADEVRILSEGTDLRLSVKGRTWINSDGKRNMPSGEVFTGPLEASAEGTITFDIPSTVEDVDVEKVRLTFRQGRVVSATAERGQEVLDAQLDTDPGARFLGELGIGTNERIQQPTRSTLFDEKIGGTVHLALGRSYPESGGVNDSAVHWDLVCDLRSGGTLLLDGEPFQESGRFLL